MFLRSIVGVAGVVLFGLAVIPCASSVFFRIDSQEDLLFIRVSDVVLGLVFAVAFVLVHLAATPPAGNSKRRLLLIRFALVWALASVPLLLWHEAQVRIRWTTPRTSSMIDVAMTYNALQMYAKDCGSFPSQQQGLNALCDNPGINSWKGPYLEKAILTDSWGTPLQFKVTDNNLRVWSCGPDRQSGTEDDLFWPRPD